MGIVRRGASVAVALKGHATYECEQGSAENARGNAGRSREPRMQQLNLEERSRAVKFDFGVDSGACRRYGASY